MPPPLRVAKPTPADVGRLLRSAAAGARVATHQPGEIIFAQGDASDSVMYLEAGAVRLSVFSRSGNEAVVTMLEAGAFFGDSALAGERARHQAATAMTATSVLVIPKGRMVRLLHEQPAFSDRFIAHILARSIRIEEDVVDQLFDSSDKRLARALLLLARHGQPGKERVTLGTHPSMRSPVGRFDGPGAAEPSASHPDGAQGVGELAGDATRVSVLGIRCAWCDTVIRKPAGTVNRDEPAVWSHGICAPCRTKFDGEALPLSEDPGPIGSR